MSPGVHEASPLALLRDYVPDRVEDEVYESKRTFDAQRRHVADHDRDVVSTRLGAQLADHRVRELDAVDLDAARGQRQRYPSRADGELEHRPAARQLDEPVHYRLNCLGLVRDLVGIVIRRGNVRPEVAVAA